MKVSIKNSCKDKREVSCNHINMSNAEFVRNSARLPEADDCFLRSMILQANEVQINLGKTPIKYIDEIAQTRVIKEIVNERHDGRYVNYAVLDLNLIKAKKNMNDFGVDWL